MNTQGITSVPKGQPIPLDRALEAISPRNQARVIGRIERHGLPASVTLEERQSYMVACFTWPGICALVIQAEGARDLYAQLAEAA